MSVEAMSDRSASAPEGPIGPEFAQVVDMVVSNHVPGSVEDALNMVQIAQEAQPAVQQAVEEGRLEDSPYVQTLTNIAEQGLQSWKLSAEKEAELKAVNEQNARPAEVSAEDWFNMTMSQRRAAKVEAGNRLDLSAKITRYEAEQQREAELKAVQAEALAHDDRAKTALMSHLQEVSDTAYKAKREEMRSDLGNRLEKARHNEHLSEAARNTIIAAIEEEMHAAATSAAEEAVQARQRVIDANGGALGLENLLYTEKMNEEMEAESAAEEAEREAVQADRVAWLKRIHGEAGYARKFDEDGNPRPKGWIPVEERPLQGPITEAEHVARLKRIHGEAAFAEKFDEHGVSRKESARAAEAAGQAQQEGRATEGSGEPTRVRGRASVPVTGRESLPKARTPEQIMADVRAATARSRERLSRRDDLQSRRILTEEERDELDSLQTPTAMGVNAQGEFVDAKGHPVHRLQDRMRSSDQIATLLGEWGERNLARARAERAKEQGLKVRAPRNRRPEPQTGNAAGPAPETTGPGRGRRLLGQIAAQARGLTSRRRTRQGQNATAAGDTRTTEALDRTRPRAGAAPSPEMQRLQEYLEAQRARNEENQ